MVEQQKKIFTLEGKLITPLLSSSVFFKKRGCWIRVLGECSLNKKPHRSYVGYLTKGARKAPNVLLAYRGFVKVTCVDNDEERGKKKIERILALDNLGCKANHGFGKIQWLNYKVKPYRKEKLFTKKKFKIRRGLGPNYPKPLQRLLIALMLHDFVHTEKHPSKIYQEITIEDEEIREACLNHHNEKANDNQFVKIIKYYDSYASNITRKRTTRAMARYDYDKGEIDFKELATELEKRSNSAYKLYNFIYHSNELKRIVEAMNYQKSSLRTHLLVMVNLAVNGYHMGTLKIVNDRINIKEISESVRKKVKPLST